MPYDPGTRRSAGIVFLLLLAFAMFFAGASVPGPSASEDVVRAVYYVAAAGIAAAAVLIWSSR